MPKHKNYSNSGKPENQNLVILKLNVKSKLNKKNIISEKISPHKYVKKLLLKG